MFFLITFLENRKKISNRKGKIELKEYKGVTIIVPCWNEESTVESTVNSILNLNYPKDKLKLIIVDDGSTDNTWSVIKKFENIEGIKILHKENGGKHTALNLALEHVDTEYLGCLDADSSADPESLIRMMSYFENDPKIMAVAPSIIVHNSNNFIQHAQQAEYNMAVYIKKMLGFLGAIHVTPGPLTIFKKKVFDDLGPYRKAHNTEDMEIAYRMQKHLYKIEQCNDAYVYTNTPETIVKLYKQRLRWIYGFINNTIDYRNLIFKKKYGNFSIFTVPMGVFSLVASTYLFGKLVYSAVVFLFQKLSEFQALGFHMNFQKPNLDPFFINTEAFVFISIIIYFFVLLSIFIGNKMVKGKGEIFSMNIIYFFSVFSIIGPFWLIKAVYNTLISHKPSWR